VKKHLEFAITMEYAWSLYVAQDRLCALSGVLLKMSPKSMKKGATTASLDRIDSTKGYVVGNVQWVHAVLNDLKGNMDEDVFIQWCQLVARTAESKASAIPGKTH